MLFRTRDPIAELARQTGQWAVVRRQEPGLYWLRTTSGGRPYEVSVRHPRGGRFTRFQTWLPVGFPLDRTPNGLFARLMMRSWDLVWGAWVVNILEACEARACV